MSEAQTPITVDIWSDIACPWCYIGKRKFERGLAAFRAANPDAPEVEVEYRSFELSPETPEDYRGGTAEFLAQHKGVPLEQAQQMLDSVTAIAAGVDLDYHFESVVHVKTVRAHQALHHAKANGLQLELKERLLRAYFVEGRHLADSDVLAALSAEVGLDADEARRALDEQRHLADVQSDIAQAREYGINGVRVRRSRPRSPRCSSTCCRSGRSSRERSSTERAVRDAGRRGRARLRGRGLRGSCPRGSRCQRAGSSIVMSATVAS